MNLFKFLIVTLLLVDGSVSAQDCTPWFPLSQGSSFEYSFFNKKDKLTGSIAYNVVSVEESGASYHAEIESKFYDKKNQLQQTFTYSVACVDGEYSVNMANFINPAAKEMFGEAEITISGDDFKLPKKLSVGMNLPDASTHMEAEVGGLITMKMDMEMVDRKVVDRVNVETPIKTFDAFKITATERMEVAIMKRNSSSTYFYAEDYGQVRAEYYDKNGKLDSYMLLTKFERE